jgi:hypothetical protein
MAAVMSAIVPVLVVTNVTAMVGASAVMVLATILAVAISMNTRLQRWEITVPLLDFAAIGALRFATGESQSIFTSLVILPVVWFATNEGRRSIAYAFVGVCGALLLPFLLGSSVEENPTELLRVLFSSVSFGLAAAVVNELSRLARRHLEVVRAREQATADELDYASEVQRALLPKSDSSLQGYQIAGACLPTKSVGGDFFDWYPVSGGLGFTLGDVMGKGVGAGIIAATARAVVRSSKNKDDPGLALARTADCFSTELGDAASFATMFHARLRANDGRVLYADAGHGLTLIVRADASWARLHSDDVPLGLAMQDEWSSHELFMGPGDMIVSFSDGVLDLFDGTLAAVDEVARLAVQANSAAEMVQALTALAALDSNPDDVTVLAVRRE